jgi:sugar lactone lactonase YvrE
MSELHTGAVRSLNFSWLRISANRIMRMSMRCVVALLLVTLGSGMAWASFSLTFQGLVQTLNTGGSISLSSPAGIVVDAAGDVYVVDTGNNRIVEVTAQGVASVVTITGLSPALSSPSGIAIDGSGNLYVADTGNSRVVMVTSAGVGSAINTGSVTLSSPRGVALDQSGDIFIADTGNNRVVEVTSGGSAAALTITVSSGSATLSSPKGLGVNVSGTLYIADSGNNRIVRVASSSTTGVVQSILGGVTLSNPSAVIVDRIGNVIIADTGNDRIAEIDTSNNGTVLYTASVSLNGPLAMALDVFGTVYIADTGDSRGVVVDPLVNADLEPGDQTYSLNKTAVGFGHVQLGASSAVTLTLPFTTDFSSGLGGVQVLTAGVASLDFTMGSDTTCNSSTGASTSCSVEVSFLPTAPGLRNGAVVLYDTSMNPILTVPLYGWGDSPVPALSPNTGAVINTGSLALSDPYQVALDGSGNIYVGDYTGKNVTKIPAGGGAATLVALGTPGGIAVQNITGVAVDGAGNLFIGDHQNSRILVVTPSGIVSVLSITGLSPALGFPVALAFDGAGNLYISDFTNGRIVCVSTLVVTGSTSSGLGTVIGTGSFTFTVSTLTGLTVDSQGNIYTAARTQNSSSIIKVTNAGVASEPSFPGITPAISNPQGVAVDAMGNVYVVDTGNSRIVKLTTAGVASAVSISGLPAPSTLGSLMFGVTADPFGNLYIPDWSNNRIVFVNVSGGVLSPFASTNVGSTSSDSPKTATVTNLGNQALTFSANPTFTANFSLPTGSSNQCLLSTSLTSGTACNVSVQFTPQSAGSLSAGITVTNNALNVTGTTQLILVSGTGIISAATTATAVSISPTSAAIGQPLTLTATVSDTATGHSSTIPTGAVSFLDTVGSTSISLNSGTPVTLSGGIATLTGVKLGTAGSHTITATYAGVSGSFLTSANTATLALSKDSGVIAGPATQPVLLTLGQAGSVPVTVTGPYAGVAAATGSLSYSVVNSSSVSVASGTVNLTAGSSSSTASIPLASSLPAGTYTVTISYAGDANYAAGTVTVTVTVGKSAPTVTLASSATTVLSKSAVTFTATVSSSAGTPTGTVTFLAGTTSLGSGTLAQGVATLTTSALATGVQTITAQYSGDADFAALTSSALTETVQDFSLNLSSSSTASATAAPGGTATYDLIVAPTSGTTFPAAVTLSITGAPTGATTTITPKTLPAGSGSTHVTLTVQLPSQTASLRHHEILALRLSPMMLGLLLPFAGKIRRRTRKTGRLSLLLLLVISVSSIMGLTGCGGKDTGFLGNKQTSYAMTFTAASGALSHSTTLNLTVQ